MKKDFIVDNYRISVTSEYSVPGLREKWLAIEDKVKVPFFLTWSWISCWLETYSPELIIVAAKLGDDTIAIGLFTRSIQKRRGIISSRQIRLHQMGDPLKDQIWMEYNDFICLDDQRISAVNACLSALNNYSNWDEMILSMMSVDRAVDLIRANKHVNLDTTQPCFAIDLESVRTGNKPYIDTLSRNTRYQIRRSIRLYKEKFGALVLHKAGTRQEALEFFRQAKPLHVLRWGDSGYNNAQFVRFHENLIHRAYDRKIIELFKVTAGTETVAIMYYHVSGETVYFYLHGLKYDDDSRLKPGLVAHVLATQYFIDQGMDKYDFMGGYSQYKDQLADLSGTLVTVTIQRPKASFRAENLMRRIKKRISG